MTVESRCYWHLESAHLSGEHVSLDGRQWCGFDLPQPDPAWNATRGWRSVQDLMRVSRDDEEREVEMRGVRWLIDVGDNTRAELSV